MNLQKEDRTTRQKWKQHIEGKDSPQTLERAIIILKTESQSALTAISTGIQPKNAGRRKKRKLRNVSSTTKKGTQPRTIKKGSQ